MDWSGCNLVETVPGKVSGVPLIRGTRMPADQVAEGLEMGRTAEEIALDHDLQLSDVLELKHFLESYEPSLLS